MRAKLRLVTEAASTTLCTKSNRQFNSQPVPPQGDYGDAWIETAHREIMKIPKYHIAADTQSD
ncbi:hypothetical protein [Bradyrhizobium monzae]|uniref:hypothetical protein n=1 Tax=Bradyrhizobium sp. Oc8 TaxID=2876780 RepID=UPI001F2D1B0D|nr:hypothetical protein [Bradyrhizobium sp. Oc8]